MKKVVLSSVTLALAFAAMVDPALGQAQFGTDITYQGQLRDGGVPANGTYDFQFQLHSNLNLDTPTGPLLTLDNVLVTDGVFTVSLDFGADQFNSNQQRYLQISVRPGASGGAYTTLSPKQTLTAAPYAMGLRLPYSSVFNLGDATAFNVVNNGGGSAAHFQNFLGTEPALSATLVAGSDGVAAIHGTAANTNAYAGYFDGRGYFSGNVGIGNDDPAVKLAINGDLEADGLTGGALSISSPGGFLNQTMVLDGNEINTLATLYLNPDVNAHTAIGTGGGNVGVGTDTPAVRLHVEGGSDTSPTGGGYIVLGSLTSTNISIDTNEIMARNNGAVSALHLNADGGDVIVSQSGNATLRTPILQVTGGSDLSEQFDVSGDIPVEPGMVVSIDPGSAGRLVVSDRAYDKRVAGIVSGAGGVRTGMMMGQKGSLADGEHAVALTGRVYCLVDASNGAIEPGDLLTTSDTPGHAMKVTDHDMSQGAIIGKAMTSLSEGTGLVLVLVSLQ